MMIFSPLDLALYDEVQVLIGYCKLFPHILEDFITREDAKEMMKASNLSVVTSVDTVVAASLTGVTSVVGKGTGKGSGQVIVPYKGQSPLAGSQILAKQKVTIKESGGQSTSAALGALGK